MRLLTAKGAKFAGGIRDYGYGFAATLRVPGAGEMQLYQPKHPSAYDSDRTSSVSSRIRTFRIDNDRQSEGSPS